MLSSPWRRHFFALITGWLTAAAAAATPGPPEKADKWEKLLKIDAPDQLRALESGGFALSERVPDTSAVTAALSADLDARLAQDQHLSVTMSKKHRLFDKRWLKSPAAHYELVGVFNRMDRAPFGDDARFACGEIRFIYRLAYRRVFRGQQLYSRLPLTVNVVYWAVDDAGRGDAARCQGLAKDWVLDGATSPAALTASGRALHPARYRPANLRSVEVNLQAVRWPSTIRPDMGGYAEYFLRVFRPRGTTGTLAPAPLENTPDVVRLRADAALLAAFKAWLSKPETVRDFDRGVAVLPERFAARRVDSIAFHGLNRAANRPFDQLLTEQDFKAVDFKGGGHVRSARAYLRRLNDMSCVGCHQGRAVAGFHFVGIDPPETMAVNAILMPASAHLVGDLPRRQAYLDALAATGNADPTRPFSDRAAAGEGGYGSHCALSQDPSFAAWTCNPGLTCQTLDLNQREQDVGVCHPDPAASSGRASAGDPCDVGRLTWDPDPLKDRLVDKRSRDCGSGYYCLAAGEGFPGGLCFGDCSSLRGGEACSAIAVGGFNECLGRGEAFSKCLSNHTSPITTKACDEANPCRDDFICAKNPAGQGACIPPYFLFQLRLDGHPPPV